MTAQHNTSVNDFFQLFCVELDQFQKFCFAKEDKFNSYKKKDPQAVAVLCLAIQSFDFGRGLKALHTNGKSSSSQMTLLRSLLECVVRIKYLVLFDDGFQNLRYTDLNSYISRYMDAFKAWPDRLKVDGNEPKPIQDAREAKAKFGKPLPKDFHKIETLLTQIALKDSEFEALPAYSYYRELCPPAHSDLGYLHKRLFSNEKSPFSCESEIYECATAWLRSAGHDLNLVMNRLKAANA
ncbi:DUF5677 domain-containing protein [Limnohabitans sp. 2KL-3]|uniref:DUF5677 domain-containing protein n=1 Tax=Limnohabitans sp. 2KL-3 TaxID=1100700 RepID=UPI000A5BEF2E|nr:DUF5677 domain-containing protein [Limnohabitans sp. 2KL-3]PUE20311.1 hypothetical protein B9Z48_05160 [Limnohabitans sp. WS1]